MIATAGLAVLMLTGGRIYLDQNGRWPLAKAPARRWALFGMAGSALVVLSLLKFTWGNLP